MKKLMMTLWGEILTFKKVLRLYVEINWCLIGVSCILKFSLPYSNIPGWNPTPKANFSETEGIEGNAMQCNAMKQKH